MLKRILQKQELEHVDWIRLLRIGTSGGLSWTQ